MYSRDSYIKMFLELDSMLTQGLEKKPRKQKFTKDCRTS